MTSLAEWMRRRERTRIIGMKKRTPYAVLAGLVEELNEENERLSRQNKQLKQEMVEFIKNIDDFKERFAKIASEMAGLLCAEEARKLATSRVGDVIYL